MPKYKAAAVVSFMWASVFFGILIFYPSTKEIANIVAYAAGCIMLLISLVCLRSK